MKKLSKIQILLITLLIFIILVFVLLIFFKVYVIYLPHEYAQKQNINNISLNSKYNFLNKSNFFQKFQVFMRGQFPKEFVIPINIM